MDRKPRILFLLHLPPPVHGSSTIGKYINESLIINKRFECNYINLLASRNLEESGKISFKKIIDFITTFLKLFVSLVKKRPQLCYLALTCTGAAFYRDLFLITLLKIFRIKRVYHLHNKGVYVHQRKTINRISYGYVFRNADVILLSKRLYADIQHFVPESRIYICPNGITTVEGINLDLINVSREANSVPVILYLSNLMKEKGVYILLEACKILLNKKAAFETIFIGSTSDISEEAFNEYILSNNLQNNVSYLGRKYNEEKKRYFEQANLFVFPTYYHNETFGLVNLEAMQYGLPIISTNEGGIPDLIEDGFNGFLVPQKNPEALADKIEFLINNLDKGVEMGIRGRKVFEERYTLEKFEYKLAEILQQLIN